MMVFGLLLLMLQTILILLFQNLIMENLQAPHETGYWYYNQAGTAEIIEEITEFPHSMYKDTLDAESYTDEVLMRPDTPEESVRAFHDSQTTNDRGLGGYGF